MRHFSITCLLLLISEIALIAQTPPPHYISLKYLIDGEKVPCISFSIRLRFDGRTSRPKIDGQRFIVPDPFNRPSFDWKDSDRVTMSLSCGEHKYAFSAHPGFLHVDQWTLGTAHPVYATHEYGYTHELDRGAVLDYLEFATEPGILNFTTETRAPGDRIVALRKEQPTASGVRARNIAYELAVYHHAYEKNRNYLLAALDRCLAKPQNSLPDGDEYECDDDLLKFVTNLYWRGDEELLPHFLQIAEERSDVLDDIGRFYSDLLQVRASDTLKTMKDLPSVKQSLICHLAYRDDLSMNSPKLEAVQTVLRKEGSEVAHRCLGGLNDKIQ